MRKILKF